MICPISMKFDMEGILNKEEKPFKFQRHWKTSEEKYIFLYTEKYHLILPAHLHNNKITKKNLQSFLTSSFHLNTVIPRLGAWYTHLKYMEEKLKLKSVEEKEKRNPCQDLCMNYNSGIGLHLRMLLPLSSIQNCTMRGRITSALWRT